MTIEEAIRKKDIEAITRLLAESRRTQQAVDLFLSGKLATMHLEGEDEATDCHGK